MPLRSLVAISLGAFHQARILMGAARGGGRWCRPQGGGSQAARPSIDDAEPGRGVAAWSMLPISPNAFHHAIFVSAAGIVLLHAITPHRGTA